MAKEYNDYFPDLIENKEITDIYEALRRFNKNKNIYSQFSEKIRSNYEFGKCVIKYNNYQNFQYCSDELKNNYKFQKEVIKISPKIIQYIENQTP